MTNESRRIISEPATLNEEEVKPENVPLPTDSMITVRLSDADLESEPVELEQVTEEQNIESADQTARTSTISSTSSVSSRPSSRSSQASGTSNSVDWEGLEKTEEQEAKDVATDESTALLLARLEQENNALATDPKSGIAPARTRADTRAAARPMSVHGLKRLVTGPQRQSLRYSLVPAPAMTELEFWAALVQDYPQTVQRLPTLTSNKIRSGVPPPLRGVVWPSIAGAHDPKLHEDFQRLSVETSPYDGLIGKDVGRSFPNVDMFKEKDGEGQQMLRRVLKAFSLHDEKIGYCQGLGFVVGPLLMHMSEAEAFAVLVRLMEHYDLRSCYTPDLAGLHLRIYQFQQLLSKHLPELTEHLHRLNVEPLYVSQWFLSFFAVTCPLPMLLRIYDIILAEGATETLMRVALSLMQRNQKKLLAYTEFEDVMQFLLSRSLWDPYAQHADDMVSDFTSLTNLVSRESLQNLEVEFKQSQTPVSLSPLKSAAASLLGRFWAGASHQPSKSNLSLRIPGDAVQVTTLRKTSSGNSLTSTMTSIETTTSDAGTASTALTDVSDLGRVKSEVISIASTDTPSTNNSVSDKNLHSQIEDLVIALGKLQHQQLELARELQREREEREEERVLASSLLQHVQAQRSEESCDDELDDLIAKAEAQFSPADSRRISIIQSKHQLRDAAAEWKEKYDTQTSQVADLIRRLDEREAEHNEHNSLREELREARQRIQDSYKDKQRLERQVQDLKSRSPAPDSPQDLYTPISEKSPAEFDLKLPTQSTSKGLREFRLGRTDSIGAGPRASSLQFNKRSSSLFQMTNASLIRPVSPPNDRRSVSEASLLPISSTPEELAIEPQSQSHDTMLAELVSAKTSEALARQELEEMRGKFDALKKIIAGGASTPRIDKAEPTKGELSVFGTSPQSAGAKTPETPAPKTAHAPSSSVGGFFSGWGRR